MFKKKCKDCGLWNIYHIFTWLDEIMDSLISKFRLSQKAESFFDVLFEKFFTIIGLIKIKDDFLLSEIQMRSACFITEARKEGIQFKIAKGPFGYTSHLCAEIKNKKIRFETLPTAEHMSKYNISFVDCKERTKNHLKRKNFPIAKGRVFKFWQKKQALKYGFRELGFPLVVKPVSGSVAKHVTININNKKDLNKAINRAIIYSPSFMVEKFIENSFVYRATVVDFDYVAVVRQIPANIVGDGDSTIKELIDKKNSDQNRGKLHQKEFTLYKIVIDDVSTGLLAKKNYDLHSIPQRGEIIYLQKNPFLKLGGDLIEISQKTHPDNIQLFKDIAIFFDIRLVGIDFLIPEISYSWKNQNCAVLELNNIPCIEMHHFPSEGNPQNVAKALVDLFFKYYV